MTDYSWGWSHFGGDLPGLTVRLGRRRIFGGTTLAGAVPEERATDRPWADGETWPDYVRRSFDAAKGDRTAAIPRIIATHHLGRPPTPRELAAVARLTRRTRDRKGEPILAVDEHDVTAALAAADNPPPSRGPNNQENQPMTATTTTAPAKPKSGTCPVCGLDVDLTRGKIKPHPAKGSRKGTANNCAGAGQKPATPESSTPADTNGQTADMTTVTPTLDLALLEANRPEGAWAGAEAATLDPALLDGDPHNPRADVGNVDDLALSLVAQGMLEPVIVAPGPAEGRYTIVAGHRRIAAARAAGMPEVPALIRADLVPGSNLSLTAQVVENLHRLPLTPIEEARTYDLLRQLGMKQGDIATAVGVNQGQVSKRLALLKLPDDVATAIGTDGGLDVATAVELTRVDAATRTAVLADVKAGADPDTALRRARAQTERKTAHQAVVDELEAKRVALVDFPDRWYWGRDREDRPLSTGTDGEPQPYGGPRTIDVAYVDHADLPCHGAAVSPQDEIVYVCLDPTRHGYPTLEQEAAEDEANRAAADEARAAAAAARQAAIDARQQATRTAALADVKRPFLTDTVAAWAVTMLNYDVDVRPDTDEVIDLVANWTDDLTPVDPPAEDLDSDKVRRSLVAALLERHGALRLAYMAALAEGEAIVNLPTFYRSQIEPDVYAGHFARLTELAGYQPTDDEQALANPPDDTPGPPTGEPPAGALAWYDPDEADALEGDEPRWVTDPAELDAILAAGHAHRVITVDQPTAAFDDVDDPARSPDESRTEQENASPVDEADPSPAPGADVDEPPAAPVDAGDVPTPGERCPASRRPFNVAGGAADIPCPLKCGALVSTTASGRVRDHDVPQPEAVDA